MKRTGGRASWRAARPCHLCLNRFGGSLTLPVIVQFSQSARMVDEWAYADSGQLKHFGGKSLTSQSHGQSLLSFFSARYQIKGLYLVDEPETALSPRSQLELLRLLEETAKSGLAQFIIATHSPILMACAGATIFSFDHQPVRVLPYEETGHYQLYRSFCQILPRF